MKRRRFLQLFGLSPAVVVAFPTVGREPDLLPEPSIHDWPHDVLTPIEPAADAPIWAMCTATAIVYTEPPHSVFCIDPYGTRPCKPSAQSCVCQQHMKEYVTRRM